MNEYFLMPIDGRKSFYDKALVKEYDDGSAVLFSYNTPVIKRTPDGKYIRLWEDWSATTGRHIRAFSGLNKADYLKLKSE